MLYPNKINAKKSKKVVEILLVVSFIILVTLVILNKTINPKVPWSQICIIGMIYVWIITIYSVNKNTNIAAHVLLQTIAVSITMLLIDMCLGFSKWSVSIVIPVIVIIANISMLVLTLISHKKYIRYTIYQLILCVLSTTPFIMLTTHFIEDKILVYVATGISILNFLITIILCKKIISEELKRKFHM